MREIILKTIIDWFHSVSRCNCNDDGWISDDYYQLNDLADAIYEKIKEEYPIQFCCPCCERKYKIELIDKTPIITEL